MPERLGTTQHADTRAFGTSRVSAREAGLYHGVKFKSKYRNSFVTVVCLGPVVRPLPDLTKPERERGDVVFYALNF
jgi:hypothetical protein